MQENEGDKEALMFDSAETGNISLLTKLLNEGIDPNIEISNENKIYNDYGVFSLKNVFFSHQTPIHLAVKNKKAEAIQLLIDAGADVDWEDIFYFSHKGVFYLCMF